MLLVFPSKSKHASLIIERSHIIVRLFLLAIIIKGSGAINCLLSSSIPNIWWFFFARPHNSSSSSCTACLMLIRRLTVQNSSTLIPAQTNSMCTINIKINCYLQYASLKTISIRSRCGCVDKKFHNKHFIYLFDGEPENML